MKGTELVGMLKIPISKPHFLSVIVYLGHDLLLELHRCWGTFYAAISE